MSAAAIASAALVISAQQAHESKVASCQGIIASFNSKVQDVQSMQTYADCVQFLYPAQLSASSVIYIKVLIVAMLVGLVLGVVQAKKDRWGTALDYCMYAFFGAIGLPLAVVLGTFLCYSIYWLFT